MVLPLLDFARRGGTPESAAPPPPQVGHGF